MEETKNNLHTYIVSEKGARIDKSIFDFFTKNNFEYSRSYIQKLIDDNNVLVNDKILTKKNYKVCENDKVSINIVDYNSSDLKPKKIDFKIVFEDEYLIVIDKPNDLVVHPGSGNYEDTLVNGLLYYNKNISDVGEDFRPGIVHRIDKKTTGLLVVAKKDNVHNKLSDMFKNREVNKEYKALVKGQIQEDKGVINAPIGRDKNDRKRMAITDINSKEAITHFTVERRFNKATLVNVKILTGRTHQIRVHFEYIQHPIIGDPVYSVRSDRNSEFGQFLHAYKLEFVHPITNKKLSFISPLPEEFNDKIRELEE